MSMGMSLSLGAVQEQKQSPFLKFRISQEVHLEQVQEQVGKLTTYCIKKYGGKYTSRILQNDFESLYNYGLFYASRWKKSISRLSNFVGTQIMYRVWGLVRRYTRQDNHRDVDTIAATKKADKSGKNSCLFYLADEKVDALAKLEEIVKAAKLNHQERRVIYHRADGDTLEEIAERYSYSTTRIANIEKSAKEKMEVAIQTNNINLEN